MGGRMRVIVRQSWRNLRARPGQALLILLATTLATTTLSMAIAVNKTGDDAWNRVWRASRGADLTASAGYSAAAIPADASPTWAYQQLSRLKQTPGVAATAGPWSELKTQGQIGVATVDLSVQVRDPQPAALDQPIVTSGRWLGQREGVVLEDGLATILHVRPADTVTIAGRRLVVLGTALAVSAPRYRPSHLGYAWVDRQTGGVLQSAAARFQTAVMPIRLSNPATAVVGTELSPLLAGTETVLYGAPQAPPITGTTLLVIGIAAVAMVSVATVRPVILGVRRSTMHSLHAGVPARRTRWLLKRGRALAGRPLLLVVAATARRPGRTAATVAGTALAVALVTVALALHGSQQRTLAATPHDAANQSFRHEIQAILWVATAALIGLAVLNAAIVTVLAARDSTRNYAIIRAVGATPTLITTSFMAGQLAGGVLAVIGGIPLGVLLFDVFRKGLPAATLSPLRARS